MTDECREAVTLRRQEATNAFWDAVPASATTWDMARGLTVKFDFDGRTYSVNTRVAHVVAKMGVTDYYKTVQRRVMDLVFG